MDGEPSGIRSTEPDVTVAGHDDPQTPDETQFAVIIYVLVSSCAWWALPPCFGTSKSTAHRRFLI